MAQLSFFFFQLRAVALVVEDLQSLLAFELSERPVVCVTCVFPQRRFYCSAQRLCQSLPAGSPASPDFARFGGSPLHEHCD